jgi:hypothetical protein
MKKFDYITPHKKEFEDNLHIFCKRFMTFDATERERLYRRQSPRWFNLHHRTFDLDRDENEAIFYLSRILNDFDDEFWQQFKKFRTEFLIINYPNINPY